MSDSIIIPFVGVQGPAGAGGGGGGSSILTGSGTPGSGTGSDGDFYLNTDNGDYYTKASGAWTLQGNLTGPAGSDGADGADGATGPAGADGADGADGATWYDGAGAPSGGLGADGDFYLDSSSGDYYEKSAGSWAVQGNLKGPQGNTGPAGSDGADGADGTQISVGESDPGSGNPPANAGDYYLNTISGDLFVATGDGTTWSLQGNLKGPQGDTGATGAAGADGADGADGTGEFAQEFFDAAGLTTDTEPIQRLIEQACTITSVSIRGTSKVRNASRSRHHATSISVRGLYDSPSGSISRSLRCPLASR